MIARPNSHSRQQPHVSTATRAAPCDLLREFALAWRLGRRPRLVEFVAKVPPKDRFPLALQLIELDVRQRAVRGDIAAPGDYRQLRFATDDQRWELADLVSRVVARVSRMRLGSDSLTSAGLDLPRERVHTASQHSAQWIEAQPEPIQHHEPTEARSWRGPKASWRGGPVRAGRFTLLEELGRGGMGVVYRARQTGVDREVALKMISAGSFAGAVERERFYREARLTARLDHPNIVPVLEVGEIEGCPFLSMPLVEGTTLKGLIAERPLSPVEAARIMVQVAEALAHAHVRGVIHRDIKPQNILISREGRVRVADFGLARDALRPGDLTPPPRSSAPPNTCPPSRRWGVRAGRRRRPTSIRWGRRCTRCSPASRRSGRRARWNCSAWWPRSHRSRRNDSTRCPRPVVAHLPALPRERPGRPPRECRGPGERLATVPRRNRSGRDQSASTPHEPMATDGTVLGHRVRTHDVRMDRLFAVETTEFTPAPSIRTGIPSLARPPRPTICPAPTACRGDSPGPSWPPTTRTQWTLTHGRA